MVTTLMRTVQETDRPGREIDNEHRKVIEYLIDNEGWTYKLPKGGGYPRGAPLTAVSRR